MLFRQKYLCVLCAMMMLLFFVIASGGCGGGSSSSSPSSVIISELVHIDSAIESGLESDPVETLQFIPSGNFRIILRRNDDGIHYSVITDGIIHSEEWHNNGAVDGHIYVFEDVDNGLYLLHHDCQLDANDYVLDEDGKYVRETRSRPDIYDVGDEHTEFMINDDGTITCWFYVVVLDELRGIIYWKTEELTLKPVR